MAWWAKKQKNKNGSSCKQYNQRLRNILKMYPHRMHAAELQQVPFSAPSVHALRDNIFAKSDGTLLPPMEMLVAGS